MARQRHIFTSKEIAHVWANSSSSVGHGKVSGGNMSFNGDSFYSYSTVIAKKITSEAGENAVVLNITSYSNTTSKHRSFVFRALKSDTVIFEGEGCHLSGRELFKYAIEKAVEQKLKGKRARKRGEYHAAAALKWYDSAKKIKEFFQLDAELDENTISELEAQRVELEKAQKIREKLEAERATLREAEGLRNWINGASGYSSFYNSPVMLRLSPTEADVVETSRGARFSVNDAINAYRFITSRRGQKWRKNGETCRIGYYQLDAINENGVVAGCHTIKWDEIERFAGVLGLDN